MDGKEFKKMMQEKRLSQRRLARILSVDHLSVWRWANGRVRVPGYASRVLENYNPDEKTVCYVVVD